MLENITLGQYYPLKSPVHALDPRVKIIGTILFIVELFLVKHFIGFAVCAAVLAVLIGMSKVPLSYIVRGLRPIVLILLFTCVLNLFMTRGTIIFQLGFLKVTKEGIYTACFMAIRCFPVTVV